ncbi:unnamed protein product [Effrenium voratum]|uniref:FAS1 domain-containing protein n=1 Tax=Effrenium voratum TaxID=2562239 RepID=A0AA36MKB0_9DINO|nr:unnamed protein product [Effrenium voratum]
MAMTMDPLRFSPGQTPSHRLRQTGASVLGGEGSRPESGACRRSSGRVDASPAYAPYAPQMPGDLPPGMTSVRSGSSNAEPDVDERPPSASKSGLLYTDTAPSLENFSGPAQNVPVLRKVQQRRYRGPPEQIPKAVWSDSVAHLAPEEEWPLHAVPLFIFGGVDRPRPAYREELKFTLRNDKYVSFALRLRCGTGDHYMGGTIGLLHNPERTEALAGDEGQLATILDLVVQPDNSVIVTAIGDLDFTVARTWMPRGLRGLQLAFVDVHRSKVPALQPLLRTCDEEPGFALFGQLVARAHGFEQVAEALNGADGPFTVFVPRDDQLFAALGGGSVEEMLQTPYLQAHAGLNLAHIDSESR